MTATEERPVAASDADAPVSRERRLILLRRIAVATWLVVVGYRIATTGIAFNRELLLLYICTGLVAASIGRRRVLYVIRDWLPFALVLVVYDLSRGAADLIGRPTLWHWQADADRWMFAHNGLDHGPLTARDLIAAIPTMTPMAPPTCEAVYLLSALPSGAYASTIFFFTSSRAFFVSRDSFTSLRVASWRARTCTCRS